jgi:ribokinase
MSMAPALPSDASVTVVSAVGDDAHGRAAREALARAGIAACLEVRAGATARQRLRLEASGERTFTAYEPGVLADWRPGDAAAAVVDAADLVVLPLFRQFATTIAWALQRVPPEKLAVDFMDLSDANGSLGPWRELAWSARFAFFGLDVGAPAIETIATHHGASCRVVTLGAAGSVCFEDGRRYACPAFPVETVVDTTGAGDAFAGVFLARRLAGDAAPDAMLAASRQAAAVIGKIGAI